MSRRLSDVLAAARKYLGTHEHNGDNRAHPICDIFGWCGVPWCAETVCVEYREAGFTEVPKNASAQGLADALCHLHGWQRVSPAQVRSGDVVKFTFSHIGMCEGRRDANTIVTIEGNHNDQDMRAVRSNSSIAFGIRPPFAPEPAPKPAPPATGKRAKVLRDTQLYNATIGTKRKPSPGHGGTVTITGPSKVVRNKSYTPVAWGGNPGGGWVLSADIKPI